MFDIEVLIGKVPTFQTGKETHRVSLMRSFRNASIQQFGLNNLLDSLKRKVTIAC